MNPHGLPRQILSLVRLPIPPSSRSGAVLNKPHRKIKRIDQRFSTIDQSAAECGSSREGRTKQSDRPDNAKSPRQPNRLTRAFDFESARNRTVNLRIKSPLLYQLSYTPEERGALYRSTSALSSTTVQHTATQHTAAQHIAVVPIQ